MQTDAGNRLAYHLAKLLVVAVASMTNCLLNE
jgi:hypothetical protein